MIPKRVPRSTQHHHSHYGHGHERHPHHQAFPLDDWPISLREKCQHVDDLWNRKSHGLAAKNRAHVRTRLVAGFSPARSPPCRHKRNDHRDTIPDQELRSSPFEWHRPLLDLERFNTRSDQAPRVGMVRREKSRRLRELDALVGSPSAPRLTTTDGFASQEQQNDGVFNPATTSNPPSISCPARIATHPTSAHATPSRADRRPLLVP